MGNFCNGLTVCQNSNLNLTNDEYVIAYNAQRPSSHAVPVPKDFFSKIPNAKVIRLQKKPKTEEKHADGSLKLPYEIEPDFEVPLELCNENEKGVPLVYW